MAGQIHAFDVSEIQHEDFKNWLRYVQGLRVVGDCLREVVDGKLKQWFEEHVLERVKKAESSDDIFKDRNVRLAGLCIPKIKMKEFHQEVQQRMAHALVGGTPAHSGASQGATSSRQVPSLTLPFSA